MPSIHEMPFICKLQTVSHISKRFPVFLSPATPSGIFFFHQLSLNFSALLWIGVHCSRATGYGEVYRERGKGAHTSLQKCLGLHFCLIRNGLTSWMVDELYIDDSILLAV